MYTFLKRRLFTRQFLIAALISIPANTLTFFLSRTPFFFLLLLPPVVLFISFVFLDPKAKSIVNTEAILHALKSEEGGE